MISMILACKTDGLSSITGASYPRGRPTDGAYSKCIYKLAIVGPQLEIHRAHVIRRSTLDMHIFVRQSSTASEPLLYGIDAPVDT